MKKISKEVEDQRQALIDRLRTAAEEVSTEIEALNREIEEHQGLIDAAIQEYNSIVEEADSLRSEATGDIQAFIDQKSEKWQEGEKGQLYQEWLDELESLSLPTVEVDTPDQVDVPDFDAIAALDEEWRSSL